MLKALSLAVGSAMQTDLTLLVGETREVEISVEEEIDKVYNHLSRGYVENFEGVSP